MCFIDFVCIDTTNKPSCPSSVLLELIETAIPNVSCVFYSTPKVADTLFFFWCDGNKCDFYDIGVLFQTFGRHRRKTCVRTEIEASRGKRTAAPTLTTPALFHIKL